MNKSTWEPNSESNPLSLNTRWGGFNFSLCSGPEEINHAVSSGRYANKVQHPCLQVVQLYFSTSDPLFTPIVA